MLTTNRNHPRSHRLVLLLAIFILTASGSAWADGKLEPPAKGKIRVAVTLSPYATMIDFAGPWEVFQDVHVESRGSRHDKQMPFELYTVAASTDPVTVTGGMKIVPDYSFDNAPQPHVIVIPAQQGSKRLHQWLRDVSGDADIVMSVCTGAFQLAQAGLLDGLEATTHHLFLDNFEKSFPKVRLKRGVRFVDNGKFVTAGGLTSGIDLALRVVDRYFGREVSQWTADYMEHSSQDWKRADGVRLAAQE